ncbi:MAG: hypothetical protein AABZ31_11215, partial [Bdellovibrionota bacterium]
SSSGKTIQEARAKGVIQVYNAYSTEDQVLIANTRFISADGKWRDDLTVTGFESPAQFLPRMQKTLTGK